MRTVCRFLSCPENSFFLFGPRGTGKSTWLQARFPDALFLDLLSGDIFRQLQARPERLRDIVAGNADKQSFVIDEVQRIPALLDAVHQLIEQRPNLRFVLTGSSARKLKRTGVDLLAGRAVMTTCHPFMAAELGEVFSLSAALTEGLIPLVLASPDRRSVLRTYLDLYLREEIQMEGLVRNLSAFSRFLEAASFSHASLITTSEIARECEVSRTTVEGYLAILEDLLIASRLPVFSKRAKRQLVGHDKFYFFDAGVFRTLRPSGPLDRPQEIDGAALEGLVFHHLRSWNDYSGNPTSLHFWRTRAGLEVDFIVYGANEFAAIEVKNASRIQPSDFASLRAFGNEYPEARLMLLHRGKEQYLSGKILCVPCERFLRNLIPNEPLPDTAWRI
jgi:predicted AAA+ superfamily ATPase